MSADDNGFWMQRARDRMEKKGTVGSFGKQAKKAGMGTQAYAKKVLAKGSKASTKTKKRAVFARNAAKASH